MSFAHINYSARRALLSSNTPSEPTLKLVEGKDKQYSTRMTWEIVGTTLLINRVVSGGGVNSLKRTRHIEWYAVVGGQYTYIPHNIRRHEVSIAKWLLAHAAIAKATGGEL